VARIFIVAMNYAPEVAGVGRYTGEIGEYFAELGHEVCVVTSAPHYPGWKVLPPYRNGRYKSERRGGLRIIRCPLIVRERMGGVWRLIAPLSFALTSAPVVIWQMIRRRPGTILCIEPTLFGAPVAILAARLIGARTVLHVQDLEVDASFAIGHLAQNRWLKTIAFAFERIILRSFDRLITISGRMAEKLADKGVASERIEIVRNWVDLDVIKPLHRPSSFRSELGLTDQDFVVLYSGNIGAKQGFDNLLEAAARLAARSGIVFIIAGEGPAKRDLRALSAHLPNVRFLPFQPYARLSEFLGLADLHVLPQAADAADLVLPSKLGGMLASGRRTLVTAAAGTELASFVQDAAMIVPPGDPVALADAILGAASDKVYGECSPERRRSLARQLSKTDGLRQFAVAALGSASVARRSGVQASRRL
jgi:colanic acid biosynthesis glycosyl transferase WcaI